MKPLNFSYKPPVEGVPNSNDIALALISPSYVQEFASSYSDPYKTFAANMGNDFVAMLTARGYSYKGPFTNTDQMVYSEKNATDLVLQPIIDLQFSGWESAIHPHQVYRIYGGGSGTEYYADGDITISGKVNLIFSEPFTNTKIWVKSIEIEPVTFKVKSYSSYSTPSMPVTDPLIWNAYVDNLSKIYENVLSTAWKHLEPEELYKKKDEANEIKSNATYKKQ